MMYLPFEPPVQRFNVAHSSEVVERAVLSDRARRFFELVAQHLSDCPHTFPPQTVRQFAFDRHLDGVNEEPEMPDELAQLERVGITGTELAGQHHLDMPTAAGRQSRHA